MSLARAMRQQRTTRRIGRRPRRWQRVEALLVELRFALRGKRAEVEGYEATFAGVYPGHGHVALTFFVDAGEVTLGVPLGAARELLSTGEVAATLFGMVAAVVRSDE